MMWKPTSYIPAAAIRSWSSPDKESAEKFAYAVSSRVRREFAELEYFIKTMEYDESEGVGPGPNLFHLSQALEKKKSVRAASFHQGSFGVEEKDTELRRARVIPEKLDRIQMPEKKEYVPAVTPCRTNWKTWVSAKMIPAS